MRKVVYVDFLVVVLFAAAAYYNIQNDPSPSVDVEVGHERDFRRYNADLIGFGVKWKGIEEYLIDINNRHIKIMGII